QIGLQNVMYATQIIFNPDLSEVIDSRQSMIEQGVNGTQPLFIANEDKMVSLEDDFMSLTRRCTIEKLQDNNEEVLFQFLDGCFQYGDMVIDEDHVVFSKDKRHLNAEFNEVAKDVNGRRSKIVKVDKV
ncbi:hypothetical protein S245_037557, partial [Arachis hypogaea]